MTSHGRVVPCCSFPITWVQSRGCVRECAGWTKGSVALDGTPGNVVAQYLSSAVSAEAAWTAAERDEETEEMTLLAAQILDASGHPATAVRFDQSFSVCRVLSGQTTRFEMQPSWRHSPTSPAT